ncbi:hypothetical protein [Roseovarius sp. MMSF_3281]|uniref:hypothetical protein n=1 Tax=Roseovarius sp. MMSF_3281 TaxID=3046694 RepID=UPI00273F085B|nr:hypothetical protein [Roseovarius sp. MMSF_3281]
MTRKQTTPHAGAVKPDERPGALAGGDLLDAPGPFQSTGIQSIAAERQRQFEKEGWTPEHDDTHSNGEMAGAAACYAMQATLDGIERNDLIQTVRSAIRNLWPWANHWWKPKTRRADLVRAGALIAAEIDRLDRLEKGGDA